MKKVKTKDFIYKDINTKYILVKSKIKNVYIHIKNGEIIVKSPLYISNKKIDDLISKKSEWIYKKLKEQNENHDRSLNIKEKDHIYILGNKVHINFIYKQTSKIIIKMNANTCKIILSKDSKPDYNVIEEKILQKQKELAIYYINKVMNEMIQKTKLIPSKVEIRKFKSIWGSCSSKKVIKINQNIIWYSENEIAYVCLHELCHLRYMNHQKEFWKLVEKYMPNYKNSIEVLKNNVN